MLELREIQQKRGLKIWAMNSVLRMVQLINFFLFASGTIFFRLHLNPQNKNSGVIQNASKFSKGRGVHVTALRSRDTNVTEVMKDLKKLVTLKIELILNSKYL